MDELPDISDLLWLKECVLDSQEELRKCAGEYVKKSDKIIERLREEIVRRYKNVTKDDCDHPIARYCGLGENECECCGEGRP